MSIKNNEFGIADMQDKILDILKYFISVCEQNDLHYWLAAGTCLGALRHQGFIPWDDDLDVFMPREDYEKLWSLLGGKADSHYLLCRTTREKNYHHRVMQIVDLETTFINTRCRNEDIEHGVYNCLISDNSFDLIDWEFAGVCDPAFDYPHDYDFSEDDLHSYLCHYLDREPTEMEYRHWLGYRAIHYWYYMCWATYKESINEDCGNRLLTFYEACKHVIQLAEPLFEFDN